VSQRLPAYLKISHGVRCIAGRLPTTLKEVMPEHCFRKINQTVIRKVPFFTVRYFGSNYLPQSQPSTVEDVSWETVETRGACATGYSRKQMETRCVHINVLQGALLPIHGTRYEIKKNMACQMVAKL
jgi:hypothetical protein